MLAGVGNQDLDQLGISPDFVVGASQCTGVRSPQHEGSDPLRKRRRKQNGQGPTLGQADHHRLLDARGVGDGARVVHPILGAAGAERPIRTARAPLVEEHQSTQGRESAQQLDPSGHVPHQLDVRNEPGNEQDVEWTLAHTLVRDAQFTTLRVLGLRHRS